MACEYSGVVRDAFLARGHEAVSCDLLPTESDGPHIQGDVLGVLNEGWDMMIAHPPCTHLAVSGAAWFYRKAKEQAEALEFVGRLLDAGIPRIALENPVSIISTRIRKPDQIIQPWQYGEPHQKTTCLWLKELPKLTPTQVVEPQFVTMKNGKRMSKWHYDSFVNLKPSERAHARSRTFEGIAQAMADQWGSL